MQVKLTMDESALVVEAIDAYLKKFLIPYHERKALTAVIDKINTANASAQPNLLEII